MKTNPLATLVLSILIAGLFPVASQVNAEDDRRLKENFVLRFVIEEESEILVDLQLLIARAEFSVNHIIEDESEHVSTLRFEGALERINEDEFYLTYTYGRSVPMVTGQTGDGRRQFSFRDIGWNSTARLTVGKEVILLREPSREHRVSIFRESERPLKPAGGNGE